MLHMPCSDFIVRPQVTKDSVLWSAFDAGEKLVTTSNEGLKAAGPRAELKKLSKLNVSQTKDWMEAARLEAVLGSCRRSLPSVRSGLRLYIAFVATLVGSEAGVSLFPPRLEWLQAWSGLFRSERTFGNYLGYVSTGCMLVRADVSVFSSPEVQRAKMAVAKSGKFCARDKLWIRRLTVEAMLKWAGDRPEYVTFARLFLICYAFLLRLPSEGLPMRVAREETGLIGQSYIIAKDDELVVVLARRKNKPGGSRLVRRCWCRECPQTCPVHVLGPIIRDWPEDVPLFDGISAYVARAKLREMLGALGVQESGSYRTHDLRRGHALDLQLSGAPLWEILQAGEWSSPAFLKYLDLHCLDRDLVVQAHAGESDSESDSSEE